MDWDCRSRQILTDGYIHALDHLSNHNLAKSLLTADFLIHRGKVKKAAWQSRSLLSQPIYVYQIKEVCLDAFTIP